MRLVVNGETYEHAGDGALLSLLEDLGADGDRVATMVNDEVVPKTRRAVTRLRDGDRVEVLVFAGGG
jgi:sulfur carrier protein